MRMSIPARRAQSGFSLLELLIALAIAAALLTVATLAIGPMTESGAARTEATKIASALRRARADAIRTGKPARLVLNLQQNTYQSQNWQGALNEKVSIEIVSVAQVDGDDKIAAIVFYPNGASSGAEIELFAGRRRAAIDVNWMTGRITVVEARRDAV